MRNTALVRQLTIAAFGAALLLASAVPAGAQATNNEQSTNVDQQFVTQAMKGGDEEIDQAQAEIRGSQDPSVKMFAQTIVRDHTTANGQIAAVARNLNLKYPQEHVQTTASIGTAGAPGDATATTGGRGASSAKVAAMTPQAYMQKEVRDHQQTIALFENEVKNGGSQELRTIAAQTLPTLKAHLAMAQQYMNTGRVSPESTPTPPGPGSPPR
jgi:putative membrane protein